MTDAEFKAKLFEIGQCYDLKSLAEGAKRIGKLLRKRGRK